MDKKAQSALEYLMTYGWALVVIVIVIAALVFLINPSNVGGNTCTGFPSLVITNHQVSGTTLKIYYSNNAGQSLKSVVFSDGNNSTLGQSGVTLDDTTAITTVNAGAKLSQNITLSESAVAAQSYVINMQVTYNDRDDITRKESASCRGTV